MMTGSIMGAPFAYGVAVLAPLFGALVAGLLGRAIGDRAAQVARTKATAIEVVKVPSGQGVS